MSSLKLLDKTVSILDKLANHPKGLGITELYEELNIPKTTVHRILTSLIEHNIVKQDKETNKYCLGLHILGLATSIIDNMEIRSVARPYLEELNHKTNEVIHLCLLDEEEIVYVDKVDSTQKIQISSSIGARAPLHSTSVGKSILSGMDDDTVRDILRNTGMKSYTPNTITTEEQLFENLREVRRSGYAIDEIENELGIRCIGAPLYNFRNKVIAGISISGPSDRITKERIENELTELILEASLSISKESGYLSKG